MQVCDYIARRLAEQRVTKVFVVQGAADNDLLYALADLEKETPSIDYVSATAEQGAGFMAEGYAKASGGLGVALATSGPGGQNLLTPICNCFYDSVPVLFITGQVNSQFMRPDPQMRQLGFQECDIVAMARPVTKDSTQVTDPEDVPYFLERAIALCLQDRKGPCLLDLPIDVQRAELSGTYQEIRDRSGTDAELNAPRLRVFGGSSNCTAVAIQFLDQLRSSKRPAILVGGGVRSARAVEALDALAEELCVPLFPTWNAIDVVTSDHRWYGGRVGTYGGAGRNFAIQNCDLLLCLGCRLSGRITGGVPTTFARGAIRWTVDVDPSQLQKRWQPQPFHHQVQADAEEFMRAVVEVARQRRSQPGWLQQAMWLGQVRSWRDKYDPVQAKGISIPTNHPYHFIRRFSELCPANAIVVYDCGGNAVTMAHAFQTKRGQRVFTNNGNSPMGFAFAAAIGAWFAEPTRPIFCVIGDGGFCMNAQELQTLKAYSAEVKTIILDNRGYGITAAFQENHYPGRYEACGYGSRKGYVPPNFEQVARAYGVRVWNIKEAQEVEPTLQDLIDDTGSVVCILHCDGYHDYSPKIDGWATPIEDMSPRLPRDEFRGNLSIDPLPGWTNGDYGK